MGFLSFLWCGSTNDFIETETEAEKQSIPSKERDAERFCHWFLLQLLFLIPRHRNGGQETAETKRQTTEV